jgi:hypothetical protein
VIRAALAAVAATLMVVVPSAQAATQWTVDKKASVRNYHGDFVIGYVYGAGQGPNTQHSAHVDQQARVGNWIYGAIDRQFAGWGGRACGWVLLGGGNLHRNGRTVADGCPAPAPRDSRANPLAPRNLFANLSYLYGTGGGTIIPARITASPACAAAGGTYAYGNYNPSSGGWHNRYPPEPNGRGTLLGVANDDPRGYSGFGLRYIAGGAALIKDARNRIGAPDWFFVHKECLQLLGPKYSAGLSVLHVRLRGRTVKASGRTAKDLPYYVGTARQSLRVSFSCGKPSRTIHDHWSRSKGISRWSSRFPIPKACAKRKTGRITIAYGGNARHKPGLATKKVRRG